MITRRTFLGAICTLPLIGEISRAANPVVSRFIIYPRAESRVEIARKANGDATASFKGLVAPIQSLANGKQRIQATVNGESVTVEFRLTENPHELHLHEIQLVWPADRPVADQSETHPLG